MGDWTAAHCRHADWLGRGWYLPGAHDLHEVETVVGWYLPGGHCTQSPSTTVSAPPCSVARLANAGACR